MASEQPNHQSSDGTDPVPGLPVIISSPATPLRTFRLCGIPPEMNDTALRRILDSLWIGEGSMEGNSTVFSLATYRYWQVATVSFHQEPDEFKKCKPGHQVYLQFPKRQISMVESYHEPDKRMRNRLHHGEYSRLQERPAETRAEPVRVTVDCDFFSMTPLYAPMGTTARYDIIAVTGLSAHAFGSWKSPDRADRMWLRDFLRLDFPDIRVFTWGYYSSIRNDGSRTSIKGISRNFLEDIKRVREEETVSRPLILIGHSLGGLVVQKALIDASKSSSLDDNAVHQSCIGVLFFGVPHLGLNPKSIEMLVQGKGNEHFLRDISTGSEYLLELERDFKICYASMNSSVIVSFYESEDTRSVETFANGEARRSGEPIRMVPRESAVCSVSEDCNRIEIRADHSRMVKFRSESDEHYQRVVAKIREMAKKYEMRGLQERLQDSEIRQIMSLISPLEPHKRHQDIRQKRLEGTGDWFLHEPAFQKWIDCDEEDGKNGSVLACSGNPGAGKSVICSLVFDYIGTAFSSEERTCVACLYCDYQDDKKQSPVNMLGVLLNQVIATLNDSGLLNADTVDAARDMLKKQKSLNSSEACQLLAETVKQLRKFYVCIDALDECSDVHRRGFTQALATVASECRQSTSIHIFFTTRPHITWGELIRDHFKLSSLDHIYLKAHSEDIRRYVSHEIDNDENRCCMDPKLRTEILDTIVASSDEMFLLPALQIQTVLDQTTISKRRKALYTMPSKLDTAFESTITRIRNQKDERVAQAMEVLKWTFLAQRPLTVTELRHALSVTIDPSKLQTGELSLAYDETLDWDNFPSEKSLVDWCLGLVIIDEETSTVRLVHKSLHDYLTKLHDNGDIFSNGHSEIAYTCLQYMCFNDDRHKIDPTEPKIPQRIIKKRMTRFCLLDYAVNSFGHHLREKSECAAEMIHGLFPDTINMNRVSTGLRSTFLYPFDEWASDGENTKHEYISTSQTHLRLQFAISCGLENAFLKLLHASSQSIDYNTKLSGSTMLLQASKVGNVEIVRTILERKVGTNVADGQGRSPIFARAPENDHELVAKLVLQLDGIDISSTDLSSCSVLSRAPTNSHDSAVKLLLQANGIDVNSQDSSGRSALSWASERGHDAVVKLLLQVECIDINLKDRYGRSAFSWAAGNSSDSVIYLLLQADGIDINSQDNNGRTALSWASENGRESVVELLLQSDAIDITLQDYSGMTAFSWASRRGHDEVVKLLLQAKCTDINSQDNHGHTALSWASRNGHDSVIKLLLQVNGIDINIMDDFGKTALSSASTYGHDSVVKLLLQSDGIDINSQDMIGFSALSWASEKGYDAVVKLLLKSDGIDINSKDINGYSPLSLASRQGYDSVVRLLLLADDIDVNSQDMVGFSALSWAFGNGHDAVVRLLLQSDDIDISLEDCRWPLELGFGGFYSI